MRNLVHDVSVHAPVESILREGLARHHDRTQRIDRGILQHQAIDHRGILAHLQERGPFQRLV